MLNEINQSQKLNTAWFHLYRILRIVKIIETENRMVIARDWGEGKMGSYFLMGREF